MSEEQNVDIEPLVNLPNPNVANAPIVAIRGQQAIGVPNVVTQTDLGDPNKVEMLFDPVAQQIQSDELFDTEGKLLDTSEQRARVSDPNLITGVPDVNVQAQQAAQIQNVERSFSNVPVSTAARGTITENDVVDPNQVVDERTRQQMLERGSLAQAQTQTPNQEQSPYGFPGDGMDLPAGATDRDILGGLKETFNGANFQEGAAPDLKSMPQIEPAAIAASNMEKNIHDQLEQSNAVTVLRHVLFEMALLGTGVLKGPFNYEEITHNWKSENGEKSY